MINIKVPSEYPFKPPLLTFSTKIYHPNIDSKGMISCCQVNLYSCRQGLNWSPALTLVHALRQLRDVMVNPNS